MGDILFDSDLFRKENAMTQLEELIKDMIKRFEKIGFSRSQAIDMTYTIIIEGVRAEIMKWIEDLEVQKNENDSNH